jgi:hypothetical protein
MTSREEKGVYGTGVRHSIDPDKLNPHELKLSPLKTNQICPVCDTEKEVLFPIADAVFCHECTREVNEWKKKYMIIKPYVNFSSPKCCFKCGKTVIYGWTVSTRVCSKCIDRAGDYENAWKVRQYARRVA